MHVNAYKSLFEHSISITLTHSTSHPQTLHVSFPFEKDRQHFVLQRAQRTTVLPVCERRCLFQRKCHRQHHLHWPGDSVRSRTKSPGYQWESWGFFILVNCKTPSNTGQIIVTSPDQKPQMVVIVWEMGPLFQGNLGWWNIIFWPEYNTVTQ